MSKDRYADVIYADFAPIYPFEQFLNETGTFNEVLIRGGIEPSGIFVLKEAFHEYRRKVEALSEIFCKPIFIYNQSDNTVTRKNP